MCQITCIASHKKVPLVHAQNFWWGEANMVNWILVREMFSCCWCKTFTWKVHHVLRSRNVCCQRKSVREKLQHSHGLVLPPTKKSLCGRLSLVDPIASVENVIYQQCLKMVSWLALIYAHPPKRQLLPINQNNLSISVFDWDWGILKIEKINWKSFFSQTLGLLMQTANRIQACVHF